MDYMKGTNPQDREIRLWVASRKYVAGEIGVEEFETIESSCTPDFKKAMINLSKRKVRRNIAEKMNPFRILALFRIHQLGFLARLVKR